MHVLTGVAACVYWNLEVFSREWLGIDIRSVNMG